MPLLHTQPVPRYNTHPDWGTRFPTPSLSGRLDFSRIYSGDPHWRPLSPHITNNPANREFKPPSADDTPQSLFHVCRGPSSLTSDCRFLLQGHESDLLDHIPAQALIFAAGACLRHGNGQLDTPPGGGAAVVLGPGTQTDSIAMMPLPQRGVVHTNNRAELCSAILALEATSWTAEHINNLIIATDSEYVVNGICYWSPTWIRNGWANATGEAVLNRDLWETLLSRIRMWEHVGCRVQFWRIPRELNEADAYAKQAAAVSARAPHFGDYVIAR